MAITHVHHVDIFHIIYKHYKRIGRLYANLKGKRTDLFASALRVLELMREEQIRLLLASGIAEEDIIEEMLGFAMTWEHFQERSAEHYSRRSFEGIIEAVLTSGAAHRCYVECHRHKKEDGREELVLVRGDDGQLLAYPTIEEARENRRCGGDVINFFHFNAKVVNDLTAAIYSHVAPPPQPPTTPGGDDTTKRRGAQRDQTGKVRTNSPTAEQPPITEKPNAAREGKSRAGLPSGSEENIAQGSQFCEGAGTPKTQIYHSGGGGSQNCEGNPGKTAREGSQNCETPPRKTASNKNKNPIKHLLESPKEIIISAPRAIDPILVAQFDFSQPVTPTAIRQLSRILLPPLPPTYKTEEDKEAAYAQVEAAAQTLASKPLVHQAGLRHFACLLAYQGDEASPCEWRAYCRGKNAGFVPRLWHLENEMVMWKMHQEMEGRDWWPAYLPQPTGLVETPPEIDIAELAGIDSYERVGMDAETAQTVADWLTEMFTRHEYGYEARLCPISLNLNRGYAIEVWFEHEDGTRRVLRFYQFDDWDLIVDAHEAASWASLDFVRHLSAALHQRAQVA